MSVHRGKTITKIIAALAVLVFSLNTCCYGLAPLAASQNPLVKRKICAALQRTKVRYADSPDAAKLLEANKASCLLLSSGMYLIKKDVAEDDVKLLRSITHEDIEALMQILARESESKYQGIKELILKNFPPAKESILPLNLYVNHIIARAMGWLILANDGIIFEDEIPPEESAFLQAIRPVISANRHNYFTREFWDSGIRGEKIRNAQREGMRFYRATDPEKQDDSKYRPYALARAFREKKKREGISFNKAYDEILSGMLSRLEVDPDSVEGDPDEVLVKALQDNCIRRILEVGCGDCSFLAAFADIAEKAGCELVGIDLDPVPGNRAQILEAKNLKIITEDVREFKDERGFDLIFSSGVMSFSGAFPFDRDTADADSMRKAILNAQETAESAVSLLSGHSRAALFTNTFSSVLVFHRGNIEKFAEILLWDESRKDGELKENFWTFYEAFRDHYGKLMWSKVWKQAASFAILARKKVPSDAGEAVTLAFDLIHARLQEDKSYTIKYDESKLTASQIEVIRQYAEFLKEKSSADIKLKPFSSEKGSGESLIAVYCAGEDFKGEGHVDVSIPEGRIEDYLLRITGMVNIALAASNIPDSATKEELETSYGSIISFIQNQYSSILDKELAVHGSVEEMLNALRRVVLALPRAYRMPVEAIEEYNTMARKALVAA